RFHRPDAFWERRYTAIGRMTEATTSLTRAGLSPEISEALFYRSSAADSKLECCVPAPGATDRRLPMSGDAPGRRGRMPSGESIDGSETTPLNSGDCIFRLSSAVGTVDSIRIKLQKSEQ
ncbi:hypothetical protein, partial [Ralstonia pseudosolanacearum]|uniref:hypothetical protein n=1 Tax=Ralstonia pseudosolanacearum TaxID=1310165 RepID=UPI001FFC0A54